MADDHDHRPPLPPTRQQRQAAAQQAMRDLNKRIRLAQAVDVARRTWK